MEPNDEAFSEGLQKQNIVANVLITSIFTALGIVITTGVIIFIGKFSRNFGLLLAGIETLLAAIQSILIILVLVGNVFITLAVWFGKRRREDDETEMLWGSLIRTVELGIWIACLFVLYRFFYG